MYSLPMSSWKKTQPTLILLTIFVNVDFHIYNAFIMALTNQVLQLLESSKFKSQDNSFKTE